MKLILAGLSSRDEMAFDLFLKRHMAGWRWQGQPARRGERLPAADVLLIDLAAHGWAQCTELSRVQLMHAASGVVAILLVSAHDASWAAEQAQTEQENWVWLDKPYNAQSMRGALTQAAELVKALQKRQQTATRAQSVTALARPVAPEIPSLPGGPAFPSPWIGTPAPPSTQVQASHVPEHALSADELAQRLTRLPHDRFVMLRKLSAGLQQHLTFEVRFTVQHCLIVHATDGWVASNTPLPVVLRVCRSDALAASVSIREVAMAQVEERLHQLGMTPHDLGDFLFELAAAVFPADHPPS